MACARNAVCAVLTALALGLPAAAEAQFGRIGSILDRARQADELRITDEEERELGEAVSARIRERYGVVQDASVHRYVTLVGTLVARASSPRKLHYQFIVLDTDGVNAFAAPGGFIHVTRGALGLVRSEAELAGVLGHEIAHVVEKHATRAIQKGKLIELGANEALSGNRAVFLELVERTSDIVMAGFGRAEELESDRAGVRMANLAGYDPRGLATFLTKIAGRNKGATERQGLYASHPEMQERLQRMTRQAAAEKLASRVTLEERYGKFIAYEATPQAEIAVVVGGAAGLAGGEKETGEKPQAKKKGLGLQALLRPGEPEKKSAEVTGSAASRGVDRERNARGGPVSTPVPVAVSAADIERFRKEGGLR